MAVADAPTANPTPEECSHPAPVTGVLAHEFAHYDGAVGPEGVRRTVTYYGPVVGGLAIQAWHCEVCGLLRVAYPDGRKEERGLFPGPQPGLLAEATPVAVEALEYGLQPRVSGLSVRPADFAQLAAATGYTSGEPIAIRLPAITLPQLDGVTWLLVIGLSLIAVTLFAMGVLAVYTYSTPSIELPLAIIAACSFVGLMLFALGVAAVRHFFPVEAVSQSVAETARGPAQLDGATRTAIALLSLSVVGLFAAGILAVYTFATPGAEGPVFVISIVFAVLAAVIKLASVAARHFMRRPADH